MSPFEINVLRFIYTLDNILVALMPWFKALAVAVIMAFVALLGRRIIRKKPTLPGELKTMPLQ